MHHAAAAAAAAKAHRNYSWRQAGGLPFCPAIGFKRQAVRTAGQIGYGRMSYLHAARRLVDEGVASRGETCFSARVKGLVEDISFQCRNSTSVVSIFIPGLPPTHAAHQSHVAHRPVSTPHKQSTPPSMTIHDLSALHYCRVLCAALCVGFFTSPLLSLTILIPPLCSFVYSPLHIQQWRK